MQIIKLFDLDWLIKNIFYNMKIEELIKDLDSVSIIEFKNYLLENLTTLCCEKNSNSKVISSHLQEDLYCKKCGCKFYKNGKTKTGVQKYVCSGCKKTISETTNTIIYHSKLSFEVWSNVIDNLLLKITGLGRCTTEMLENSLGKKTNNTKSINADSASAYQKFCLDHNLKLNAVPSGFHSNGRINIAEINGVHSQLEIWLSKFRGISIRHLQEYLNWFTYIFIMKKRFNLNKLKTESYSNIVIDNNYINSKKIFSMKIPIDLNIAYAEYNNQS